MELTAQKTTLHVLMSVSDRQFRVPPYQLPYAWGNDQVDELWSDLTDSLSDTHFMGSIVLNVEDENTPEIIDGQQRLMTLSVYC